MVTRRKFLAGVGAIGGAALVARDVFAQQQAATNFAPMDQTAYRPTLRPPKPGATPSMTDAERDDFERGLKCQCTCPLDVYTCRTTDFTCPVSPAMHQDVIRLVAGGYTAEEIRVAFVETYGEVALTSPVKEGFNWAGYVVPGAVMLTGLVTLTWWLRRRTTEEKVRTATFEHGIATSVRGVTASPEELAKLERALREEE